MEASNPHLRLPSIVSAYSCTSGANQSPPVYRQSYSKQHQTPGFPNNTARVRHTSVQDSKLELNSHGDHQRISTLTKMNCMTNSSPINSVSTDSSCNFSHSTNVNHTSQLDSNIQYEHGTHDASLTQYTQQQAKEQNARAAQYPSDPRQHPSIQRIEQLQQLEQQQQQLNYQQLVQQHSLSQQQQQQQLIRYQNQIAQQLVLQQQGDQFPQSLNPVQQQYLLQQRYQQQQHDQQQANLQQQLAYQQQQQQYLASQSSHESANPNQLQANQQAFLQQQLAYQHHLLSQQQATGPNAPEVKQECLDTQQQALLQQIGFQQQNIKTEVNGQQAKQEIDENRSQQHQSPQQQVTYQQPKSAEQGNHNLKQESFGQQNLHPSLQEHALYQPKLLVQQNLKPEPSSTEQQQRNSESNDSPTPNQIVQQISFKPEHATQLNKEIAVQNQLILQQQLAYQHQLLAQQQQQQNAGKSENINPVFFQNVPQTSKAESNRVITPQQNFLQHQLAYEQQLIAQHQKFKSEPSSETNFPKQTTDSLKQKTIESVPSNQQNLIHQQIEYQQQILQQQTAVKSEPNEISQKYLKEAVQQSSQQQQTSLLQQAPYPKPDSVSGKQDSLISLPLQQSLQLQQAGSLPSQIGPQHLLSGHPLPPQFAQLSLPRDVSQLLPGGQQLVGSDSRPLNKVESTHPLLPGQIVLPGGQKITNQPRSVLTSSSIGSASGDIKVESSQSGDSDGSASCVPPPLTAIRVVSSGKVLKESNPGPAVKSDQSESKASIRVPLQWKRLIANSMVIYVSPSNTALSSMDQLKAYLQTQGTCKCGLECPLQCDSVFSFDAKVASKPWSPVDIQDFSTGEFTKLCNHKRKHMTMMGFEPDNPLDGKRLDGPDFRKKRKVYGGPYSNATGPRKPRMPKDASPAPVLQTLWNDPSSQQPPAPVPPTPLNPPPTIPPPSLSDLPSTPPPGPRMFNPRMTMLPPQQSFMQQAAQLDQQRIFRYQHPSPQQQPALSHRIYQGTPPMMGTESLYANNAYPKTPNQSGEESQNQHSPAPQALSNPQLLLSQNSSASSQAMPSCQQESMEQQLHTGQDQQMQPQNQQMQQQSQQMQQQTSQQQGMQPQNQQMHVAQIQAMQQQAQMQAVQAQLAQQMQHQHQQAVQNQQIHLQGVPTSQQQMLSNQTHSAPMQTQQTLPQQQMASSQLNQLQMKQLNQQSSQQHQMQMQQIQAQLAQMQQMQQEYDRQNQQQSSHQPADQYQTEQSNQLSSESAHYGKFSASVPNQSNNMQDPKLSLLSQQQYRQASYPIRAPYESFPPHSAPSNYPPEGAGSYESINCDNPYQNNTNQSVPGGPGVPSSSAGVPANTYLPQPVFNYQRQTQEQLAPANIQAVQPTQRPTPPWQQNSRPTTPSNPTPPSPYERVPPLHPSNIQNNMSAVTYTPVQPEASVPVSKKRTKTAIKSPNSKKLSTEATRQDSTPTYPSFMDDPSGYLAQQTALLNSTISKQCDIRVSSEMLENKNLQRLSRRYNSGEGSTSRTPDSSVRNESSETTVERIKNQHADLKGPIQGGTVSTSNRSPGGILVPVEASSPRSTSSMNSTNSPQPYSTPPSPAPKSPERSRSMPVASGHTVSCNTLTSVLAGRSNTSLTPSVTSPPPASLPAKSPLEMVQSVVSSIQLPPSSQQVKGPNVSLADIKVSTSLPSHILVSSNGQLIVASQPQSLKSSPSLNTSPASSSSSLMTNVTGAVSQVIPSLGLNQQVLGQPTVLVNTLQAPLLFQPNIMTMDNINTVQIPQLTVSSPVGSDSSGAYSPRSQGMISPESAKRKALKANKQRKVSPQKVTSMLLTPQQGTSTGTSVVMQPQQSFAQPMLQTLILPNKGNFNNQLITTSLQPLNLVQQFPTIQQFLVPAGLGGMAVMSQDGTATLLQDTVQLNVLTPVQASSMFGGQSILTSPNSMVIRSPNAGGNVRPNASAAQGQFITTNSQNQLIVNNPFASQLQGQLSPIITNLSPNNQQISFTSPTSQRQGQEYIQCGQTLIPITSQQSNSTSPGSSSQNAAVLQHNALMQQQMNLLQQANQEQTSQNFIINETGSKTPNFIINDASSKTQNFIITTSDKQPGSTNYILSPKSDTKSPGGQTHFIINTSDSKSSGQSFIITSPTDSKQLLTSGNFILTSDKSNNGNLILSTAPQQHIQQQEKVKLLHQTQQQQIQQITQQQLQQLQQTSQQLQQFQQSQQLQTQQLQQSQQLQQVQQLQQAQQIQLQNHRLNMSTQTSIQPTSSANQMIQASPITIYVSQSQSSSTTNLYTSSSANALTNAFPCVSSSNGSVQASNSSSSYSSLSSNCPTSSVYTISSTAASSVYTSSPPDTTTLSPVEAGGVPSPCHSLEVPPSPLLGDDNQPSPTSTSVHLVSSSNTDWSDGNPDSEGFATPKASSSRVPTTSNATFVKSSSKDFVESSSSPPTHRSYSRHHHSHHHRSHSHHHHQSSSKHHHSKPSREHHSEYPSHRSDSSSSRHHSHHVTNIRPDEGSDSDHSNDSSDDSNSALATTTAKLLGLSEGDLVWGQVKGYPSWPGKLISPAPTQGRVWVKWFGMSNEPLSEVEPTTLKSLSQGLEAHHRSRKKLRKSRKLNTQLENAIQEAMAELDRMSETPQQSRPLPPAVAAGGKMKQR